VVVDDPFDLQRFVDAQEGVYATVLSELRSGRKRTHWMWFVFPQVAGLGHSAMAQLYAISGLEEAAAYLAHPVLGPRLRECAAILLGLGTTDAEAIFGATDAMKLSSSMTLFAQVDEGFWAVLDRFFDGRVDDGTMSRL
jgi:uncharacterized protein (DUF1810 family)